MTPQLINQGVKNIFFHFLLTLILIIPLCAAASISGEPLFTIDQGGSDACFGTLFDSGGEGGDYANNEYESFTICPSTPSTCITFELNSFDLEYQEARTTDQLLFFAGDQVIPSALITAVGANNLNIGTEGGGGVCYQVQTTANCLTVLFVSDGQNTASGFVGEWSCSADCTDDIAPTLTTSPTPTAIENLLSHPSADLTVTAVNCAPEALAIFNGGVDTGIAIEDGLLLTTGEATYAIGPNDSDGYGNFLTGDLNQAGDADLDTISTRFGNGILSGDACYVELEVTPNSNVLQFEYAFGSEEFPEFVLQEYNDIFAFFVSGPGIDPIPGLGKANIATLPDGTLVEIDAINNQVNPIYYRPNTPSTSLQYDGFIVDSLGKKKSLTARTGIVPCNTYILKLAIADRGDRSFDSGVFIADIRGGAPEITADYAADLSSFSETCGQIGSDVVINLFNPGDTPLNYQVRIEGTATRLQDYQVNIPATISFPPGDSRQRFPIEIFNDNDIEGEETIIITLSHDFGCGEELTSEARFIITDQQFLRFEPNIDTIQACQRENVFLYTSSSQPFLWNDSQQVGNTGRDSMQFTAITDSKWIGITSELSPSCILRDSVYIEVLEPDRLSISPTVSALCVGEIIDFEVSSMNGAADGDYLWQIIGQPESNIAGNAFRFEADSSALLTVTDTTNHCVLGDSIAIDVLALETPIFTNDTILCLPASAQLLTSFNSAFTYAWRVAGDAVIISDDPLLAVSPTSPTNYVLITQLGGCSRQDSIFINPLVANTLNVSEDQWVVPGEQNEVQLQASLSGFNTEGVFSWVLAQDTLGQQLDLRFLPNPDLLPATVVAIYEDDCQLLLDSIRINILDIIVPNFFSPNGDSVNDEFRPFSRQALTGGQIVIYNRWGQKVHEASWPAPLLWDGRVNNEPAPADVYLFQVSVEIEDRLWQQTGQVTLAR